MVVVMAVVSRLEGQVASGPRGSNPLRAFSAPLLAPIQPRAFKFSPHTTRARTISDIITFDTEALLCLLVRRTRKSDDKPQSWCEELKADKLLQCTPVLLNQDVELICSRRDYVISKCLEGITMIVQ